MNFPSRCASEKLSSTDSGSPQSTQHVASTDGSFWRSHPNYVIGDPIHHVLTNAAKDGRSIDTVCEYFWRKHKQCKVEIQAMCQELTQYTTGQDAPSNPSYFRWWKLMQMNVIEHDKYRPATVNYKRNVQVPRNRDSRWRHHDSLWRRVLVTLSIALTTQQSVGPTLR